MSSFVEALLLQPHVYLPTNSFMECINLARILGRQQFIDLVRAGRLSFVFVPHYVAYVLPHGIVDIMIEQPNQLENWRTNAELAARHASEVWEDEWTGVFEKALVDNTVTVRLGDERFGIFRQSETDLITTLLPRRDLKGRKLLLPYTSGRAQFYHGNHTPYQYGPRNSYELVHRLLGFAHANLEIEIAKRLKCSSISSGTITGSQIGAKQKSVNESVSDDFKLYAQLRRYAKIPDIGYHFVSGKIESADLVNFLLHDNCLSFQEWFHANEYLDEHSMADAYIDLVKDKRLGENVGKKIVRLLQWEIIGAVPGASQLAAISREFVLPKFDKNHRTKLFLEDLAQRNWRVSASRKNTFTTRI